MELRLNQIKANKEHFTVNLDLNFGRFGNEKAHSYEICLKCNEFILLIEDEYNDIKKDIEEDDKAYNDTSDFSVTNYCSLDELMKLPIEFDSIFKGYLDRLLFTKLFYDSPKNKFVINSTELIKVEKDEIIIRGKVFEINKNLINQNI